MEGERERKSEIAEIGEREEREKMGETERGAAGGSDGEERVRGKKGVRLHCIDYQVSENGHHHNS